jgi:single-stranded-DNA-specific exonuclease
MVSLGKLSKKWRVKYDVKNHETLELSEVLNILLENRGLKNAKDKKDFLNPPDPTDLALTEFSLNGKSIGKAIDRIKLNAKKNEKIIIYGDYDADGICSTAILWEALNALGFDVFPHIPERFSEGYGLNSNTLADLKKRYPNLGLIITIDNGIVANEAVNVANNLGLDVIICDHHLKGKILPDAHSIIHTEKTSGSGIAWIFAREVRKKIKNVMPVFGDGLELAAIGTVADQIPLIDINRSIAKFGIERLRETKRPGLNELIKESGIEKKSITTSSINFMLAPRINAMGRLSHALDSLRLLCTRDTNKAQNLARELGKTNSERQKIVGDVVLHAKSQAEMREWKGIIILSDKSYHEGVIGLAAAKLVEEYYRPAIVISQGEKYSKGSARSVAGFNIIETIRMAGEFLVDGGGHPMAAGFTVETAKLTKFTQKLDTVCEDLLTEEILTPQIVSDMNLNFKNITYPLVVKLVAFEPFGIGNFAPQFVTEEVEVAVIKTVGTLAKHLKLKLKQNGKFFDAIGFGMGNLINQIKAGDKIGVVYNIEENTWNGNVDIQLKLKDIKLKN